MFPSHRRRAWSERTRTTRRLTRSTRWVMLDVLAVMPELTRFYSVTRIEPAQLYGLLKVMRADIVSLTTRYYICLMHSCAYCNLSRNKSMCNAQRKLKLQSLVNIIRPKALSQTEIPGFLQSQQQLPLSKPRSWCAQRERNSLLRQRHNRTRATKHTKSHHCWSL